ncbi:hypothetical protein ACW14Y_05105 [Kitasatospora sp. cg17-2]
MPETDWHRLRERLPQRTGRRFDDAVRRDTAAVLIWTDITQALPSRSPLLISVAETRSQRRRSR